VTVKHTRYLFAGLTFQVWREPANLHRWSPVASGEDDKTMARRAQWAPDSAAATRSETRTENIAIKEDVHDRWWHDKIGRTRMALKRWNKTKWRPHLDRLGWKLDRLGWQLADTRERTSSGGSRSGRDIAALFVFSIFCPPTFPFRRPMFWDIL